MKRLFTWLAAASLVATAWAESPKIIHFNVGNDSFVQGASFNGKWATFEKQAGEESTTIDVKVIDLTTGEFVTYTPQKFINYKGKEQDLTENDYSVATGVSDDGKVIYGSMSGYPAYFTVDDLTWHGLSMGSATDNRNLMGSVFGRSGDGKYMAGWFAGSSLTELKSALWKDGEIQKLNNLPTYEDMYKLGIIDSSDYKTQKDQTPNYTFRKVSENGKYLLLGIDHNRPNWGCSYGVYDIEKETFSFILAPAETYGHSFTDSAEMSNNGEWVTGNISFIGKDQNGYDDYTGVFRYHVPSGKLEVFGDLRDRDMLATAIDDKGTILAGTPESQPIRNLAIRCENLWVDLSKILTQKYDINYEKETGMETTGYPVAVSSDCRTVVAQAEFRGGAYALTFPVDFAEAAKGTSLLTEYTVSPVPGKSFAKLNDVMIRFSYGAVPAKDAKVLLKDKDGKEVASTKELVSFSSQNLVYTIKFNSFDLKAGEEYTVEIPAGTFVVPETTMGNPEIKINYFGRDNEAVKPVSITPKEDSFINVFSMNSAVAITFDADLSLSTVVQAKLYEDGKSTPLTSLTATVDGTKLYIYPASERRLAKDHDYYIEIPEGLVYDLSGTGANAAIKINYKGAFVPTPTEDPARPFFEDFNSPNDALYNMLLIDGDGNMPTEEMQGFGFDQWNTPWNFSIRDEGAEDYCAASHSLYSPVGQSNDWMMIPQLTLNDKDYYLSFKAQSYAQNRNDKLKIVVWEYDEVIGALDDALLQKAMKEGKELATINVVPSKTEGLLEGSWTNYEFPLKDYAGKKVYIGFVNENRNQSLIFVDDIAVEYRGAYTLTVATEPNLINAAKTTVTAYVNVNAEGPFKDIEAEISVPALNYSKTEKLDKLNLTSGSKQEITFTDVPLESGKVNSFTVTTKVGGLSQTYTGKIVNHAFEIGRRVLLEEGTGMWCGNCPYGEIAIENLTETMPDQVAIISVHNGDALAMADYTELLALGGYPNGRIDRIDKVFAPLYNNNQTGEKSLTSPEGNETFKDMVVSELSQITEGEIKIVDPVYYSADKVIDVPVSVRFSVNRENAIYNVFTAVVEDGLEGYQTNYLTGQTQPLLAWWGAQPGKVSYTYNNVARAMVGGFYGISGRVPSTVTAGESYVTPLKFELPSNVKDTANMHFVVALIDATTSRVINSDVCKVFSINDVPGASSVDEIAGEEAFMNVSVENGVILVNGEAASAVYAIDGKRVRNAALANGIYVVNHNGKTAKVLVK